MPSYRDPETGLVARGTTNRNKRGSTVDRRRRRQYLVDTYRSDTVFYQVLDDDGVAIWAEPVTLLARLIHDVMDMLLEMHPDYTVEVTPTCRCYRCGDLLTADTVEVDRIVPGCKKTPRYPNGGTYVRENIRPSCGLCGSEQGGELSAQQKRKKTGKKIVL